MITKVGHQLLTRTTDERHVDQETRTYYSDRAQPRMSKVRPTDARKARRTTLNEARTSIKYERRTRLALEKEKGMHILVCSCVR